MQSTFEMEPDLDIFSSMNDNGVIQSSMNAFNAELILQKLANNDNLVRMYHEAIAENKQIQQNLESLSGTANQIRQMYTNEKDRADKLSIINNESKRKLHELELQLKQTDNERINNDTLSKQTIAELEYNLDQKKAEYLSLCQGFMEQANILQSNSLSTQSSTRKSNKIMGILHANGISCKLANSPSKIKRKSTDDRVKAKTSKKVNEVCASCVTNKVMKETCEKSTQYQQSKATRSTCTSTFIQTTHASTMTDENESSNGNIDVILDKMIPVPHQLSPIKETRTCKTVASTQTNMLSYCTQGTITTINNIRKRINYVKNSPKKNFEESFDQLKLPQVKMEDTLLSFRSMSNLFCSAYNEHSSIYPNPMLLQIWTMLGELIFTIIGRESAFMDEKRLNDIGLIEKIHEIRSMISEKDPNLKETESNGIVDSAKSMYNGTNDCLDEHSRDSIESYNSGKIVISKIRNLNNSSPILDDSSACSVAQNATSLNGRHHFIPITLTKERQCSVIQNKNQKCDANNQINNNNDDALIAAKSNNCESTQTENLIESKIRDEIEGNLNQNIEKNQHASNEDHQLASNEDEMHFKVPKRKSTSYSKKVISKRRKIPKVRRNNEFCNAKNDLISNCFLFQSDPKKQDLITSLFGDDLSDDDDMECNQFEEILNLFHMPSLLSPIRDLEIDDIDKAPTIESQLNDTDPTANKNCQCPQIDDVAEKSCSLSPLDDLDYSEEEAELIRALESDDEPVDSAVEMPIENDIIEKPVNETIEDDNIETNEIFDDFSPASPKPEDQVSTEIAPTIPINTSAVSMNADETLNPPSECDNSILDCIIHDYSLNKFEEITIANSLSMPDNEVYLLFSLRNAIEKYCIDKTSSSTSVDKCIEKMFSISRQPKKLAASILEVLEDTKENLSLEFTPPAPAMQLSHQKCLILVSHIARFIPSFDKYIQFELERKLFTFIEQLPITNMINLTQFYIALIDIEQPMDKSKIRLFIYKCLYYFTQKSIPLIFNVIMAHPFVLPHANSIEFIHDPLIRAVTSILTNIPYSVNQQMDLNKFKRREMFMTLKRRYGYFADKSFPIDCVISYCLERLHANRLKNVSYALILIAKRQGFEYAVKQIIEKHLVPMLHHYFLQNLNTNTVHDGQIDVILSTMGSILKTSPIKQNIDGFINLFVTCLNATERQSIQEAAISSICQLNRFGTTKIYHHLAAWKPNYEISPHIQAMLNTIVYRKARPFWFDNVDRSNKNVPRKGKITRK